MMAAISSILYSAVAAQNVFPSYLSGSARMAPTNLPVSPTASIKGNWVLGEVWKAMTQVPSGACRGVKMDWKFSMNDPGEKKALLM